MVHLSTKVVGVSAALSILANQTRLKDGSRDKANPYTEGGVS